MKALTRIFQITILFLFALILLPAGSILAQSSAPADIGIFEDIEVAPGDVVEVPVRVENAANLFAIDLAMNFDPELLAVQDADPNTSGVQVAFGTFLDPGLLLYNTVDNQAGTIQFVMSQVSPSEPKSGEGVLIVIYFEALQEGALDLEITNLQIADSAGNELAANPREASITIKSDAPVRDATSVPVVDPTGMIQVPTLAPTPTITPTPVFTATSAATATAQPTATLQPVDTAEPDEEVVVNTPTATAVTDQSAEAQSGDSQSDTQQKTGAESTGFFLFDNWWIILIAAGLVGALGFYLFRTKGS